MTIDDSAARRKRADELKKQIDRLRSKPDAEKESEPVVSEEDETPSVPSPTNYRSLIHDRMRDLDRTKGEA